MNHSKIIHDVPDYLRNIYIKDTLSKHILYKGDIERKYDSICTSEGHPYTTWGMSNGNTDAAVQKEYIQTMLKEKHMYPVKFLVVRHPQTGKRYIWCDNMHHTLMQCKMLEKDFDTIEITDLMSYYIVDISDEEQDVVYDPDFIVRPDEIHNVFEKSHRKTWFQSTSILDFEYTMGKFIRRNREWYDSI